jgi:hypothetical protein
VCLRILRPLKTKCICRPIQVKENKDGSSETFLDERMTGRCRRSGQGAIIDDGRGSPNAGAGKDADGFRCLGERRASGEAAVVAAVQDRARRGRFPGR